MPVAAISASMRGGPLTEPLPHQIVFCDQLEDVDLHGNALTGALPEGIWRLTLLEYLTLNNNRLVGPLPEGLGYLRQARAPRPLRPLRRRIAAILGNRIATVAGELRIQSGA